MTGAEGQPGGDDKHPHRHQNLPTWYPEHAQIGFVTVAQHKA
jgi:hypothetical protein